MHYGERRPLEPKLGLQGDQMEPLTFTDAETEADEMSAVLKTFQLDSILHPV